MSSRYVDVALALLATSLIVLAVEVEAEDRKWSTMRQATLSISSLFAPLFW